MMECTIPLLAAILLSYTIHVHGAAQGGCAEEFLIVWEKFENMLQTCTLPEELPDCKVPAGNADEETCFDLCKADTTCYAFDWDSLQATNKCYHHKSANGRIGTTTGITHYRKRAISACPEAFYVLSKTCQVFELWNYQGIFPYSTSTVATDDVEACVDACLMDSTNCVAFDYHYAKTSDNCRLYDESDAFDVMSTGETGTSDTFGWDFYFFDECGGLRDPLTQGFHLYAEYHAASGATTTTGGTFNECWDTCFGDLTCLAFGWIDSSSSCIVYDDSNVNTTVATAGTFHHVLFNSANYAGGGDPPSVAYVDPAENCFHVVEEKEDTRSLRATALEAGNSNYEACADQCRLKDTSFGSEDTCVTFDYVDSDKPFKANRCYYYTTTPTITFGQTHRHMYIVSPTARKECPPETTTVVSGGCTWRHFEHVKGLFGTGTDDTKATTLADCMTACLKHGHGCAAIDFNTANLCTLYPKIAAYFYEEAGANTDTDRYVRTNTDADNRDNPLTCDGVTSQ